MPFGFYALHRPLYWETPLMLLLIFAGCHGVIAAAKKCPVLGSGDYILLTSLSLTMAPETIPVFLCVTGGLPLLRYRSLTAGKTFPLIPGMLLAWGICLLL